MKVFDLSITCFQAKVLQRNSQGLLCHVSYVKKKRNYCHVASKHYLVALQIRPRLNRPNGTILNLRRCSRQQHHNVTTLKQPNECLFRVNLNRDPHYLLNFFHAPVQFSRIQDLADLVSCFVTPKQSKELHQHG